MHSGQKNLHSSVLSSELSTTGSSFTATLVAPQPIGALALLLALSGREGSSLNDTNYSTGERSPPRSPQASALRYPHPVAVSRVSMAVGDDLTCEYGPYSRGQKAGQEA